jgi:diguanylate cyclase
VHGQRKDGSEVAVAISLSAICIREQWHAVGIVRDETEQQAREDELRRLATTDPLTELFNRRHFLARMEQELERLQRYAEPTALLMMDLDEFKQVNDTRGHAAGDAVLRHFAVVARHALRKIDLLGRLGGEEFGALLPGTDLEGAHLLADRLRQVVADSPATTMAGMIRITVSIGVTLFMPTDLSSDTILARADRALYRAKDQGRNRVETELTP